MLPRGPAEASKRLLGMTPRGPERHPRRPCFRTQSHAPFLHVSMWILFVLPSARCSRARLRLRAF
eukprot:4134907-Pyramimonas_sp.AAC.1